MGWGSDRRTSLSSAIRIKSPRDLAISDSTPKRTPEGPWRGFPSKDSMVKTSDASMPIREGINFLNYY